jgi:hypothetical protein
VQFVSPVLGGREVDFYSAGKRTCRESGKRYEGVHVVVRMFARQASTFVPRALPASKPSYVHSSMSSLSFAGSYSVTAGAQVHM